jgi:hypothetical protein
VRLSVSLQRLLAGRSDFVSEPLLQLNGKSMIDPTHRYYRGDSQGGIFGTTSSARQKSCQTVGLCPAVRL